MIDYYSEEVLGTPKDYYSEEIVGQGEETLAEKLGLPFAKKVKKGVKKYEEWGTKKVLPDIPVLIKSLIEMPRELTPEKQLTQIPRIAKEIYEDVKGGKSLLEVYLEQIEEKVPVVRGVLKTIRHPQETWGEHPLLTGVETLQDLLMVLAPLKAKLGGKVKVPTGEVLEVKPTLKAPSPIVSVLDEMMKSGQYKIKPIEEIPSKTVLIENIIESLKQRQGQKVSEIPIEDLLGLRKGAEVVKTGTSGRIPAGKTIEEMLELGKTEAVPPAKQGGGEAGFIRFGKEEIPLTEAEKYAQEMTAKQEAARISGKVGILGKVKNFYKEVKSKLVDFNAPIEDVLRSAEKKGAVIPPEEHITNQIDRVLRSPTIAGQFARDNGLEGVIKNIDNLNNFDQYLIAKQAKAVEARGIETGRDLAKDQTMIDEFAPQYEKDAKIVNEYSRKLLDYSVESGLISKDLADILKERYPDYVPIKRIFNELEETGGFGTKAVASLSKQTVVQKLVGSEREIEGPVKSLIEKTADAFKQGEKNKAARMLAGYKDLPGNPFEIIPLRTAENVKARIDIYKELGLSKPIKVKLERLIQTRSGWMRKLQAELNQLNKEGIQQYLKRKSVEPLSKQQAQLVSTTDVRIGKFKTEGGDFTAPYVYDKTLELKNTPVNPKDTRAFINELINEPPEKIAAIRKKIGLRDLKLSKVLNEVDVLRGTLNEVKLQRSQLFDEARLLKDAESRGKSTFSTFKDGIKEIYETTPEIATAAKSLNVQQLNVLGRIFALPVRIARVGITGINLPFLAANMAKDQVTGIINSSHWLKTSIANPAVFTKALFEAVGHGKLYEEMAREGALGTSYDIARNQAPLTVERLRSKRNIVTSGAYIVRHPSELLRGVENIISRGEELTRIQQYEGTKRALLKQGLSESDAKIGAARAARENTVNFARRGEWGTVLNSAFLYLNASIQGTRTFVRNFRTRPIQTAAKVGLTVFTPVAITTTWNLADPKRREVYQDISEYEKQNNIIIIPPNPTRNSDGSWNVIKIPLSQEINNIASMARRPIEQAYKLDPVSVTDIASALAGTVSPINPSTGSLASTLTPQAIKPTIEAMTNKNLFTGRPQVPQYLNRLLPSEQFQPYTSGTMRKVGGALGISPIKAENFVKGTTGGVGSQILNTSDRLLASLGIIPKNQIGGQDIIKAITARFTSARGGQFIDDFYSIRDKSDKALATLKAIGGKAGDPARAKFIKNHPELAYQYLTINIEGEKKNLLNTIEKSLSDLRKQKAEIMKGNVSGSKSLLGFFPVSDEEKKKALEEIDRKMMLYVQYAMKRIKENK